MALDRIANPLLQAPEMRTSGRTFLPHAGNSPDLGAGQMIGWSILSPIEFVFRETEGGKGTRGRSRLADFYTLRQDTTATKIWSFLTDRGWLAPSVTGLQNDDPVDTAELALSYRDRPDPAIVSFYDSPGFTMPPHQTAGVDRRATKVFLLQSFEVWCEVSARFTRGRFQASPARLWNNLICVRRENADTVQWTVSSAALISGRAIVDRPLCD